jgi:hypothetical protein
MFIIGYKEYVPQVIPWGPSTSNQNGSSTIYTSLILSEKRSSEVTSVGGLYEVPVRFTLLLLLLLLLL